MKKVPTDPERSFLHKLLKPFGFACAREKGRLEAFLSSFPGEYCGWASGHSNSGDSAQSVAYSNGFCSMLGLESISKLTDIQGKLAPSDAAALEGLFERMEQNGLPFSTFAHNADQTKAFKLSGTQGRDKDDNIAFNILWLEDVSEEYFKHKNFEKVAIKKAERLEQLQAAFDSLPQPRWIRDEKGKILWTNDAYSDALGLTHKAIIEEQKELSINVRKPANKNEEKPLIGKALAAKALETLEKQYSEGHITMGGKRILMKIIEKIGRAHV